jgi:hypothetical protein
VILLLLLLLFLLLLLQVRVPVEQMAQLIRRLVDSAISCLRQRPNEETD